MILINLTRTKTLKSPNMSVLFPFSHFHDNQTHFKEKSQNSRQNHHDRRHNLNLYNIFFFFPQTIHYSIPYTKPTIGPNLHRSSHRQKCSSPTQFPCLPTIIPRFFFLTPFFAIRMLMLFG